MKKKTSKQIAQKVLKEADQFIVIALNKDRTISTSGEYSEIFLFLGALEVEKDRLLKRIAEN